jgi:hypothetical protein
MERRSAIRNLMIMAGGIAILPSCSGDKDKASIYLNNLDVSADQENLLAEIAETFIPATDTPGAKALSLHLFVLKMLDDCHEQSAQQKFLARLDQVDELSRKHFDVTFRKSTTKQRNEIFYGIENKKYNSPELEVFCKIMKDRTIQGYLNSKYVMTELIPYELIPSRYNGYFPVKNV